MNGRVDCRLRRLTLEPLEHRHLLAGDACPGELDPAFGNVGFVTTDFLSPGGASASDAAHAIAVDSTGVVVAGWSTHFNPGLATAFALARYNADGTPGSFGNNGGVLTELGSTSIGANDLVVQDDGKIIAVGQADRQEADFAIVRYDASGSLDATFGDAGIVIIDFFEPSMVGTSDTAYAIALDDMGRIVVAGQGGLTQDFALARLDADGNLDPTFGEGGRVVTQISSSDAIFALVMQGNDILVAGSGAAGLDDDVYVARYLEGGGLDPSFGTGGIAQVTFPGEQLFITSMAVDPASGDIVVAGNIGVGAGSDVLLLRFDDAGVLDASFDGDGILASGVLGLQDTANAVVIQPDGNFITVGNQNNEFGSQFILLQRFTANGVLDPTFGNMGVAIEDLGMVPTAFDATLADDGHLYVVGRSNLFGSDFFVARFFATTGDIDTDQDGVGDPIEDGAPNDGDGDNNGVPDRQENNVASFPTSDETSYITLAAPAGLNLSNVTAPSVASPSQTSLNTGAYSFEVAGLASPGDSASVEVIFADPVAADTYFKFGPTPADPVAHWYEFPVTVLESDAKGDWLRIQLDIVDGSAGDGDLTANGRILDPSGPVSTSAPSGMAVIAGTKFHDIDGDGRHDPGEPKLPGWTVYLDENRNGVLDWADVDGNGIWDAGEGEQWTVTDASGNYQLTDLDRRTYFVAEVPQPGWTQTAPPVFAEPTSVSLPASGRGVAIGHLNPHEDALPDMVAVNFNSTELHFRNADGSYTSQLIAQSEGIFPETAHIEDFSGDGLPDVAVLYTGDFDPVSGEELSQAQIRIFLGEGGRQFTVPSIEDGTIIRVSGEFGKDLFGVEPFQFDFGDVNGDNMVDVVANSRVTPSVSVLLGNGDGTFDAPVPIFLAESATGLALGNFDADATLELVVAVDQEVRIIDQPSVTNQTLGVVDLGESVGRITVFDAFHNGNDDVAVILPDTQQVRLVSQDAMHNIAAGPIIGDVEMDPRDIEAADLEGDGDFDLFVANNGSDSVTVYTFDAADGFSLVGHAPVGSLPNALAAGDLDGNGQLDVVTANVGSADVTTAAGNPHRHHIARLGNDPLELGLAFGNESDFSGQISGTVFLDLDQDGRDPDEVGLSGWRVFLDTIDNDVWDVGLEIAAISDGQGIFEFNVSAGEYEVRLEPRPTWKQVSMPSPSTFVVDPSQAIHTGIDFGVTQFSERGTIQGVKWFDIDEDGIRDSGEPGIPGATVYLDLNFDGQFDPSLESSTQTAADGSFQFTDLLHTRVYAVADVPTGNELSTFPPNIAVQDQFTAADDPRAIATADFNSDGVLDIAVGNGGQPSVTMLFGTGGGLFAPPQSLLGAAAEIHSLALMFVNDDALPDLVLSRAGGVDLLLNNPAAPGTFAFVPLTTDFGSTPLGVIDMEGDGDDDLALLSDAGVTFFSNDAGALSIHSTVNTDRPPVDLVVADFGPGGNGLADIAVLSRLTIVSPTGSTGAVEETSVEILINQGDGTITKMTEFLALGGSSSIDVNDLDEDGDQDILFDFTFPGIPATGGFCLITVTNDEAIGFQEILICGHGIEGVASTHALLALQNNGDGSFQGDTLLEAPFRLGSITAFSAAAGPGSIVVASTDNLVLIYDLPANVFDWANDPDRVLEIEVSVQSQSPGANVIADVDNDGDTDILVADSATDSITVLRHRSDGTFHPVAIQGHLVSFFFSPALRTGVDFGTTFEDDDSDGVADNLEAASPNNGDGNGDMILDADQINVASLPNAADGTYVTLEATAGTLPVLPAELVYVQALNDVGTPPPPDVELPMGMFRFEVAGFGPGATVTIQITAHGPAAPETYYKFGPEPGNPQDHWWEFTFDGTTGAQINGNVITLTFIDGGRGDADGLANGVIVDPGAPATLNAALAGDFNGNNAVEQADLDLVLLNWGLEALPVPNGWVTNLPTGRIDQDELDAVLLNWGATRNALARLPSERGPLLAARQAVRRTALGSHGSFNEVQQRHRMWQLAYQVDPHDDEESSLASELALARMRQFLR